MLLTGAAVDGLRLQDKVNAALGDAAFTGYLHLDRLPYGLQARFAQELVAPDEQGWLSKSGSIVSFGWHKHKPSPRGTPTMIRITAPSLSIGPRESHEAKASVKVGAVRGLCSESGGPVRPARSGAGLEKPSDRAFALVQLFKLTPSMLRMPS